jgi:hypothetical protein
MGRQIQFHMLADDMRKFFAFVQERDPVIVTLKSSCSPEIQSVADPSSETQTIILWNRTILSSLERKHIVYPGREYYGIDLSLPILEFSPSESSDWNGRPGLLQGRLYGLFEQPSPEYEKWYNALARWIRKNCANARIPLLDGYIGPSAYEWFKTGGLLLPMFLPPITNQWLSWVEAQDQYRVLFSK